MIRLQGVFAPVTTPFGRQGELLLGHLEENVKRYARSGIHGYLALGSNGENKSLTWEEKLAVVGCIAAHRAPGQGLLAAAIFESTRETIDFARHAHRLGADCVALLPPSYFRKQMTDCALIRYFTDVASAVEVPCILYRAPQYAGGVDLSPAVIRACAAHPNIIGIKDSSGIGVERLLCSVPQGFAVLAGSAAVFTNALMNGAAGGALSIANACPRLALWVYRAYLDGDYPAMIARSKEMVAANSAISDKYGVAGVKYAMELQGFYGGDPRLPLLPLGEEARREIAKALECLPQL